MAAIFVGVRRSCEGREKGYSRSMVLSNDFISTDFSENKLFHLYVGKAGSYLKLDYVFLWKTLERVCGA